MALPSRADSVISVANEAEYRDALSACEALEDGELCTVEFSTDIDLTTTGGSPVYEGEADLHLIGVGAQREIFANTASDLQFIYAPTFATVTIENLQIRSFQWSNSGGAVGKWNGDLAIIDSIFDGNAATGGGAVYFSSAGLLSISDSLFTLNTSSGGTSAGGAIIAYGGTVNVERSEFTYNATSGTGGGGAIAAGNGAVVTVVDSTFEENSSTLGGAIRADDTTTVTATNTTFYSNNGGNGGGAVWADEGNVEFTHVSAYDNNPGHVQTANASATFTTFGSVYQDLSDTFPTCSIAGNAESLGYNWAANDYCWSISTTGDTADGDDPQLAGLSDNGGPTRTARALYGSDLVNAIPLQDCDLEFDQRGVARPQGAACDIGAVELAAPFPDVAIDHQFAEEIFWLVEFGVASGYGDGTFRPTAPVSRQAMAAFMFRFAGEPEFTVPATPTFPDVPTDHQFYGEIEWLASNGIASGYSDDTFRPTASVSRQAMAAFMFRFAGEPEFVAPGTPTFPDVPTDHQFFDEIEWLASTEITGGFGDGTYRPSASVSRQAMAAFLFRFGQLI
jgi:predicted outer membrane repeat protein